MDRGAIRCGELEQRSEMLLPFVEKTEVLRRKEKAMEWTESNECDYPGFPWKCYGPLDPDAIEDLELPENQAEGPGHRYLLCSPYLPGFLVKQKDWGKHRTASSVDSTFHIMDN